MSKSRDIADSAATINYIDGLTSDAQTQLDGKQAYDSNLTSFVAAFTLPTTDGTADQVLTTNGSGTLAFADAGGGAWELIANQSIVSGTTQYDFTGLSSYRHLRVVASHTTTGGGTQIKIVMGISSGTSAQNPRDDSYRTAAHIYEVSGAHAATNGTTSGITSYTSDADKPYFIDCSIMNFNDSSERTAYLFSCVHNQSFNFGTNGGGYIDYTEAYDYLRIILNASDSNTGKIMILGVAG